MKVSTRDKKDYVERFIVKNEHKRVVLKNPAVSEPNCNRTFVPVD